MAHYRVPKLTNPNIVIRPARNQAEVEAANWLVFHNYVAEGYWEDDVKHVTENRWLHSSHRDVFVAVEEGEVVGTVSIIRDSSAGLPSDAFQPKWLDYYRGSGDRLAEVSAFAIDKSRAGLKNLSFFLMKYYMQYSFFYSDVDRLVKACRPNHADFYADVLRFEKVGNVVFNNYARVPAQFLSLNLIEAHQVLSHHYKHHDLNQNNMYRFLMVDEHPNLHFPDAAVLVRSRQRDWAAYAGSRLTTERGQCRGPAESQGYIANMNGQA